MNSFFIYSFTVATSTLAMGVNLPARLVVVKSSQHYACGTYTEYSETQILQMIGRAGRPQFDTSATAVIMTKHKTKVIYIVVILFSSSEHFILNPLITKYIFFKLKSSFT